MAPRTRSKRSTDTPAKPASKPAPSRPDPNPNDNTDWDLIEEILKLEEMRTLLLHGRYGAGKTYAGLFIGRSAEYAVTLTPETCAAELRGTWIPRGSEFEWHDGPFTAAMREGARIVINEISHASDDVIALLYPFLESADTSRLTLPTRETVVPAAGLQIVATDNRDPDELPPALLDRFEFVQHVDRPHPAALARLSEPLRRAAERCFGLEEERAISLRSWLLLDRLKDKFGIEKAARAIFGNQRGKQIVDGLLLAQEELAF